MEKYTIITHEGILKFTSNSTIWKFDGQAIVANLSFRDFRSAISFIVHIAFEADRLDHHPNISNTYNKVQLILNTHDADNQITTLDLSLADFVESALSIFKLA